MVVNRPMLSRNLGFYSALRAYIQTYQDLIHVWVSGWFPGGHLTSSEDCTAPTYYLYSARRNISFSVPVFLLWTLWCFNWKF